MIGRDPRDLFNLAHVCAGLVAPLCLFRNLAGLKTLQGGEVEVSHFRVADKQNFLVSVVSEKLSVLVRRKSRIAAFVDPFPVGSPVPLNFGEGAFLVFPDFSAG